MVLRLLYKQLQMMKRLIYIFLLLAVVLVGTSCKKWLDLKPQDGIVSDDFWKTKEQVKSAVVGCYASLLGSPDGVSDRSLAEYLFLWGELRADMLSAGAGITSDEQEVINVNILPTNSIVSWSAVYRTINYCNTVLDNAPQVLQYDNTFTQAELDGYVAEAKGLRALLYFYLVRSFGDVPLKLTSTATDEDIKPIAKQDKDSVLNQMVVDLKDAEGKALETYGSVPDDAGRLTKYSIETILADVYLWQENYAGAIAECDKVIDSHKYSLVEGNSGWFSSVYGAGNSSESIFEFQFDAQKLNTFYTLFATSKKRYVAAERVMEDIYTVNYDDETLVDVRGANAAVRTTDNTIWKFVGLNSTTLRSQDASYAHWFVYRYADVLLMKAEACSQAGRGQDALDLVKVIRDRAHALVETERSPDAGDAEGVAEYVLDERAREFAFEGKRWYDVLRNARRNHYAHLELLLNMVEGAVPADRQQSALAKYQDVDSHYFPVLQDELLKNNLLTQNPFYE